ncbi:MAG: hypothetical protein RLZZ612_375 [Pseudomonadota bacterium]
MNTPAPSADPQRSSLHPQPQIKPGTVAQRVVRVSKPLLQQPAASAAEGLRLSKVVMGMASCSRMEAERLIEAGRVQVNGEICQDVPRRIQPQQRVEILGTGPAVALAAVTVLLHKPAVMSQAQWMEHLTLAHHHATGRSEQTLLKKHLQHLHCVAPLEVAASGLVVLTQHKGVARVFQEPLGLEHELMAEVQGPVLPEQLQHLHQPPSSRGDVPWPTYIKASISHQTPKITRLRLAIKGYQVGDTLDLCQQAGLRLQHLVRIRIGRISLKHLPEGQWRFLLDYERF